MWGSFLPRLLFRTSFVHLNREWPAAGSNSKGALGYSSAYNFELSDAVEHFCHDFDAFQPFIRGIVGRMGSFTKVLSLPFSMRCTKCFSDTVLIQGWLFEWASDRNRGNRWPFCFGPSTLFSTEAAVQLYSEAIPPLAFIVTVLSLSCFPVTNHLSLSDESPPTFHPVLFSLGNAAIFGFEETEMSEESCRRPRVGWDGLFRSGPSATPRKLIWKNKSINWSNSSLIFRKEVHGL